MHIGTLRGVYVCAWIVQRFILDDLDKKYERYVTSYVFLGRFEYLFDVFKFPFPSTYTFLSCFNFSVRATSYLIALALKQYRFKVKTDFTSVVFIASGTKSRSTGRTYCLTNT